MTATTWNFDLSHSSVNFHVRHLMVSKVHGRFAKWGGLLEIDNDDITKSRVEVTIETASVDTKEEKRDAHLRSPDFFDAEAHPYIRFVADEVVLDREPLTVHGHLHARGASVPLTLEVSLGRVDDELEVEAITEADQRELGMTWNVLGVVGSPTKLMVKGRLIRDG